MHTSFHNSTHAKRRSAVLHKKVHAYATSLVSTAQKSAYTSHESLLALPGDEAYQSSIQHALRSFGSVKHVVLVGIGGSSLGTEAICSALQNAKTPSLLVFDQIDADALSELQVYSRTIASLKDVALVIVSKSGSTTETMVNAVKVMETFEKRFKDTIHTRTIFIGDEGTPFMKVGAKKKVVCISIPHLVGGRFSVFSAVGMVPLTLLGIDTVALRKGALAALQKKEMPIIEEAAVLLALHAEKGMHTVNFFALQKRLERCGYWYRQLLAESIGKNMTTHKTTFTGQILPIVSSTVDLHSMAQLYLSGYSDIYTHFVSYAEQKEQHTLPAHWLLEHMPFLKRKTATFVEDAIKEGVLRAYDDQKLPYRQTELQACTAYEIGFLMSSLMAEVMCIAHILDVDAFDQPSVELYKKHTRVLLGA